MNKFQIAQSFFAFYSKLHAYYTVSVLKLFCRNSPVGSCLIESAQIDLNNFLEFNHGSRKGKVDKLFSQKPLIAVSLEKQQPYKIISEFFDQRDSDSVALEFKNRKRYFEGYTSSLRHASPKDEENKHEGNHYKYSKSFE